MCDAVGDRRDTSKWGECTLRDPEAQVVEVEQVASIASVLDEFEPRAEVRREVDLEPNQVGKTAFHQRAAETRPSNFRKGELEAAGVAPQVQVQNLGGVDIREEMIHELEQGW